MGELETFPIGVIVAKARVVARERSDGQTEIYAVDRESGREIRTGLAIPTGNKAEVERHVREVKKSFERGRHDVDVVEQTRR